MTSLSPSFVSLDEAIPPVIGGRRLRERGPAPTLADSEVLTTEVVGEYLGLAQDSALFAYFRQHYSHFFPALSRLHRTTFVRQAANLWQLKERLWQQVLSRVPHGEHFAIIDSFLVPVCQFAGADRCRRFRAEAAFGKDTRSAPDLLWVAGARAGRMAWAHHPLLYRSRQRA